MILKTQNKKLGSVIITIILLSGFSSAIFPVQDAYATHTITWRDSSGVIGGTPYESGNVLSANEPTYIQIDDPDAGAGPISVTLTSSKESITIQVPNIGGSIFRSQVIFMPENYRFSQSDTITVTIDDPACSALSGACTGGIDTLDSTAVPTFTATPTAVKISSTTDGPITSPFTPEGIALKMPETSGTSLKFKSTFTFTTVASDFSSGVGPLRVSDGDIISFVYDGLGNYELNGIVLPEVPGRTALIVPFAGEDIIASYTGTHGPTTTITADLTVSPKLAAGGGGTGGLTHPGLVVDTPTSSDSGGSCSGDCEPPTLGVDKKFNRIVEKGFSYNGNPVDVEYYYTPYPLITVNVGEENTAVLKIFDNHGPANIEHVALAFGLGHGETFTESKAIINYDRLNGGIEKVWKNDPENALDNIKIDTSEGDCNGTGAKCLIVTIFHTFRAPLEFNMVSTYVWDTFRNGWQNYYNHGIHIEGKSLNPPKEHNGIDKGNLIHLIEIEKNKAIDENGNIWTFDKTWTKEYIPKGKIIKDITSQGYDRNHAIFETYKKGQELLAQHQLDNLLLGKNLQNIEIEQITILPKFVKRADNPELQMNLEYEKIRAENLFKEKFNIKTKF